MTLVGRDAPGARIAAWLDDRARAAGPPVLFVAGEAGIGKTALVESVLPAGALRAAAAPWRPTPYGVLDQIVPAVVRADRAGEVDPADVRAALAGTVIFLDDLHWSDEATLDLLPALADAVAGDPVALVGAYRDDELPRAHPLRRVRARLRHRRRLAEVTLGPLEPDEVAAMITALVGGDPAAELVAAVTARTEGLPFFVEEMVAALDATGVPADPPVPDTVRDAVLLRAAVLGEPARATLDAAAVLGVDFDADIAAALAGVPWPDALDECGLLVPGPGGGRRFRHALTQEAVYAEVPWSRRRALHLAAAERLAGAPASAARHLLAAHEPDRARPALVAAADAELAAYAYRDAARLLRTALEAWPPGRDEPSRLAAVDRLARCAELSGDHATAVTGLRELIAAAPDAGTGRRLAVQYELLGHWPQALAAREAAATAYAAAGQPAEAAAERLAVAAHLRSAASFRAALDVLDAAGPDAAGHVDLRCRIDGLRGNVLSRMGRPDEGLPVVRAALDTALAHGLAAPAAEVYQRLADSLEHAGDDRAAGRAYDTAYEFCASHGQDAAGQLCRACATVVLFTGGRWDRAVALAAEVPPDASAHARAVAAGVRGLVLGMRGRPGPARAALLESRSLAVRIDLVAMELLSTWGLALLDEHAGRTGPAAASYRHVLARVRATEERHYCVPVLQFAVARFAADGSAADLGAATALLADAAARTGQPEARAAFAYALGESAADPGDAADQLGRAVDRLRGLDRPIAAALVGYRAGVARLAVDPDGAARLLGDALATARRLKARALVERIAPELARAGVPAADAALSPREDQVLRLVGAGLTNREIGQRLFLSVRTVEMHVRNGVAKLGCRTRAEAAAKLVR